MDFKINIENMKFENNSLTFDMKGEREFGLDKSIVNSLIILGNGTSFFIRQHRTAVLRRGLPDVFLIE
jgi:hypothetical protein